MPAFLPDAGWKPALLSARVNRSAHEDELHAFLTNIDMTVSELEQRTLQSGFALLLEELIKKITHKREKAIAFTKHEKVYMGQLETLLKRAI